MCRVESARLGALDGLRRFGRPMMPPGFRYVLMLRRDPIGQPLKPIAFADVSALARHLHRQRGDQGLQLNDAPLLMEGRDVTDAGVSVWAIDPDTQWPRRFLGWAYVNGASRVTLEAALRAEQPGPVH